MLLTNSIYNMLDSSCFNLPGCSSSSSNPCWSFYSSIQAGRLHPKYIAGFSSLLQSSRFLLPPVIFSSGSRTVLHCRLSLSFLDACFSSLHTQLSLKHDNCAAVPFKSISSYQLYLPYPSTP